MTRPRARSTARQVALFALGVLVLLPPVLLVFNRPVLVAGVPLIFLYLFSAWSVLIGLAALIARGLDGDTGEGGASRMGEPAQRSGRGGAESPRA